MRRRFRLQVVLLPVTLPLPGLGSKDNFEAVIQAKGAKCPGAMENELQFFRTIRNNLKKKRDYLI
jgi:hypothetical protein